MIIGNHDTAGSVFVIAEIGNNHEGDLGRAKEMIQAAAAAGADAVKFQTIVPDRLVSATQTQRIAQLSRFRFSHSQFRALAEESERQDIIFLSTPFDLDSVKFLDSLVPAFKIASPDNTFFPLLDTVADTGKPILLSCGLCDQTEITATVQRIRNRWNKLEISGNMALLHCVSAYPTPTEQAGLATIRTLEGIADEIGYSDHTLGIEAAVLSVGCGARIIEKHFTLDKNLSDFRDHQFSADPMDLATLVRRVRQAEAMLGDGSVSCADVESEGRRAYRRSIVARMDITADTILAPEHLDWVRPGGGLEPGREAELLGRRLSVAKQAGEMIQAEDTE